MLMLTAIISLKDIRLTKRRKKWQNRIKALKGSRITKYFKRLKNKTTMRQILFRGKRKDNQEWAFGYYAVFEYEKRGGDHPVDEVGHFILEVKGDRVPREEDDWVEVDGGSVGQYTQLEDVEGAKIFFGDIIFDGIANRLVKWSNQNAAFYMGHTDAGRSFYKEFITCGQSQSDGDVRCDTIKVIGNLTDNPELLGTRGGEKG
jgi:hypothetical protein